MAERTTGRLRAPRTGRGGLHYRVKTKRRRSPSGSSTSPAEEVARPGENPDAGARRRVAVTLRVADMGGRRQVDVVEAGQLEEHAGPGLAAAAAVLVPVGTEPPTREGPSELRVDPGESPQDLVRGDLASRDARLVGHDEANVEARTLAGERRGDVGHEHGVARRVHHRAIVLREGERATPVDEQRALGRSRHPRGSRRRNRLRGARWRGRGPSFGRYRVLIQSESLRSI